MTTELQSLINRRDDLKNALDEFEKIDHTSREAYDDMLDECNDELTIGRLAFAPSKVLKECDPVAYDVGFDEYVDSLDLSDFNEYTDMADELADVEAEIEELEENL